MTRFGKYLEERGIGVAEAAAALRLSKGFVSMLARGRSDVSMRVARRIRDWSGGAVDLDSWPDREEDDAKAGAAA